MALIPRYLTYRVRLAAGFGSDVEVECSSGRKMKNARPHGQAKVQITG